MHPRLVLKFGGKALETVEKIYNAKDIILSYVQAGYKPLVVVSAMGNMTDTLLQLAKQINSSPPKRELDMLLTAGERISMSLLTMALDAKGLRAVSFTGSQSGIITDNEFTNARIKKIYTKRIEEAFCDHDVIVVAGFQGMSEEKEITTLGRGGSDTTAVALAHAFGAQKCLFFKDVPGLFSKNPNFYIDAEFIEEIDYEGAFEILENESRPLINLRAIRLAQQKEVTLEIVTFNADLFQKKTGTVIRSQKSPNDKNKFYLSGDFIEC
jgi:aspartate kinase